MPRRVAARLVLVAALLVPLLLPAQGALAADPPWISGTSPANGPVGGGTVVGITGWGFVSGATVTFGGVPSPHVTFVDATRLEATAPPGAAGTVVIAVTNPDGQSRTMNGGFSYDAPPPPITVSAVAPATGAVGGGTVVSIVGSGFVAGTTVSFGGFPAIGVSVLSTQLIIATTPAGPAGLVSVLVTSPAGASAVFPGFAYGTATTGGGGTQPSVTAVSPTSGSPAGGTGVSITGVGFVSPATVTFGGMPATNVVVVSPTLITATTPANPAGAVTVLVGVPAGAVGGLTAAFTYALAAPLVTSIAPASGPLTGGVSITISGSGFLAGATVSVGGIPATNVAVVSATQLTATTPPGSAGPAVVLVTNPGGSISGLATGFTYSSTAPAVVPPSPSPSLTLLAVSPSMGALAGGTAITITGSGFVSGATVTIGAFVASATVISATQIVGTAPAAVAAGAVTVTVTNPGGGSASLPVAFTYVAASSPPPSGGAPLSGGSGLFVFGGGSSADLVAYSGCAAATAVFWTTDAQGGWVGYIPSAPVAVVNAAWNALFPTGIPAGTAIFARCG